MFYNYVFVFEDIGYAKAQFNDLHESKNAQFIPLELKLWNKNKKGLINFLSHIHFSRKINRVVTLPFKSIWKNIIFNFKNRITLDKTKPFCFIIHARCYERFGNFLPSYLKKEFKDCVIIIYFSDLLINHRIDLKQKHNLIDSFFSFDEEDAKKNGFIYYENPYSMADVNSTLPKSDIFFIGKAKNRFNTIISLFELLTDNGFNCDFYITGVNKNEQLHKDKINYIQHMKYDEVLRHIISTQCIVELIQEGASSPTLRSLEAVCYNKKLLTNCKRITKKGYFDPRYMLIFDDPRTIDIEFLRDNNESINYKYAEKLSPLAMVNDIDKNIQSYLKNLPKTVNSGIESREYFG